MIRLTSCSLRPERPSATVLVRPGGREPFASEASPEDSRLARLAASRVRSWRAATREARSFLVRFREVELGLLAVFVVPVRLAAFEVLLAFAPLLAFVRLLAFASLLAVVLLPAFWLLAVFPRLARGAVRGRSDELDGLMRASVVGPRCHGASERSPCAELVP